MTPEDEAPRRGRSSSSSSGRAATVRIAIAIERAASQRARRREAARSRGAASRTCDRGRGARRRSTMPTESRRGAGRDVAARSSRRRRRIGLVEELAGREIATRLRARYAEIIARIQDLDVDGASRDAWLKRAEALDPELWMTPEAVLEGVRNADALFEQLALAAPKLRGSFLARVARFDRVDLREARHVPLFAAEGRGEKRVDQRPRQRRADHARAEAQHVHVVVLDRLPRRVGVVADRGANAGKLARRDRRAGAAAADDDAAIGLPVAHGLRHRFGDVGVVDRRGRCACRGR